MTARKLEIRGNLESAYGDVFTPQAIAALENLAGLDADRKAVMAARIERRRARATGKQRIEFLDPLATIARTKIKVQDARAGAFDGGEIPKDLRRQWIQGTGPAAKPNAAVESSIRNVAYALLSGADGWMFDGEDALGQISTMSLDNQRNLKLAIHRDPVFLKVAELVAGEMNKWAEGFFGRRTIGDWKKQLDFTTKIFRRAGYTSTTDTCGTREALAFRRPSLMRCSTSSTTISDLLKPERRWCCTYPRFRPPRKRRCGTTYCRRLSNILAFRTEQSKSTCSSNRSKRVFN